MICEVKNSGAAFARLRDQLVDVGGFVAFMLAQLLDVLGEGGELDQPGMAERDFVLGGGRRDPGEISRSEQKPCRPQ